VSLPRREFLRRSGLTAAGLGLEPGSWLCRTAEAAGPGEGVLVWVFLRGGVDGLALCAPYFEPEYYARRPSIALPRPRQASGESLIDLDGQFGLHPALAPLKALYSDGRLAFLHAVGCADLTLSHFDAQEFVETGNVGVKSSTSGWLNRTLARSPGSDMMQGVSLSSLPPRAFLGPAPILVARDLSSFDFAAPDWRDEAEGCLAKMYGDSDLVVAPVGRDALRALATLKRTPEVVAPPANGAAYPEGALGESLRQAAQLIKAGLGTRCLFINGTGGFDTHSLQLANNAKDFAGLGAALAAFDRDLGRHMDRVVVLVSTEFGRAVYENGARGTDHGTAGAMLLLGGRVRGGRIHGRWPGLERPHLHLERDLAVTTDFRDVFIEVAARHLGIADAAALFPLHRPGPAPGVLD
jgi:uncharacterized protein (DUF1501 family)